MPRLSLWNSGRRGADYRFIDRAISNWFGVSGTAVYIHLYLGPHDQTAPEAGTPLPSPSVTSIQDILFLENRDRKYSDVVYEMRGVYNVQDVDFDLRQFGLFLQNDTLFLEFHLNDMIALLGRKIMPGDVLELPHLRDDAPLDPSAKAINKFYVVEDTSRASDGYSPTWWPHIWRIKVSPMTGAQEYQDILDKQAKDPLGFDDGRLGDLMTTLSKELEINEAVVEAARESVKRRNFETRQFYVVPGDENTAQYPWIWAGDGAPPNGAEPTGSGYRFPDNPAEGDYYLRTDYEPRALFRRVAGQWRLQELDWRKTDWTAAHRLLLNFINESRTETYPDGSTLPMRQALSKAVKPKADF